MRTHWFFKENKKSFVGIQIKNSGSRGTTITVKIKWFKVGKKKHKGATYSILDFSKVINRRLVKYNTIESRISKAVASVYIVNWYTCSMLYYTCAKVHANIAEKNKSVGVLLHLKAKQPSIYSPAFDLSLEVGTNR